jgi:hypothetical protein
MKRERLYECLFHCGEQPKQEICFWSCHRKGSKANTEGALRTIRRKYGVRTRQSAVIDDIWRV